MRLNGNTVLDGDEGDEVRMDRPDEDSDEHSEEGKYTEEDTKEGVGRCSG